MFMYGVMKQRIVFLPYCISGYLDKVELRSTEAEI